MSEEAENLPLLNDGSKALEVKDERPKHPARYRASVSTRAMGYLAKESPALGAYVIGFLTLGSRIDTGPFFETLKERLITIPRFRSVYKVERVSAFHEIEVDDMDFGYHFQVALDGQKPSFDEVAAYASEKVQSDHLDSTKPLWYVIG